jgi:ribosome biogenesis GTPase / thiamine phosphate phosphatase
MPSPREAEVLATFGRGVLLRFEDGTLQPARPFGRKLSIACGDRVTCETDAHGKWLVREVRPRRSALWRSNARGGSEVLVANLDLLCVVLASKPEPDLFVVDRFLCAARSAGLDAAVLANKSDLPLDAAAEAGLATYAALGLPVLRITAREGTGLGDVERLLAGKSAALVGQSGVGKSSLIQRLTADGSEAVTGTLIRDDEGRHTTTTARRYELPQGGALIDSPGVRDYAPSIDHLDPASLGFIEIDRAAQGCRFQDCRHLQEPRCAVLAAVERGSIDPRRYESYRRLRRLSDRLREARGHSR